MDDIDNKLSILDFTHFMVEFKQAQDDIVELKSQPPPLAFDTTLVIINKEEGLVDLMGRPLKDKGNKVYESSDQKLKRKRRHRDESQKRET